MRMGSQVLLLSLFTTRLMADRVTGAAARRERRLRAWRGHERLTVAWSWQWASITAHSTRRQ